MRKLASELFAASPALFLAAVAMLVDLIVCSIGLLTDHTIITGMPAWLKPAKFAISTGIYALSLAVIIRHTPIWKRTLRVVGVTTALALTLEIILIDLQAARHTTSHFNVAAPFDLYVFEAMGAAIALLWISAIVLTTAAFHTSYKTPAWTIVVRAGMLLAVLGMGTGAIMTTPSRDQLQAARTDHHMTVAGSHTVGGPDGGKGLPIVGWSTEHGDVRVAHFLGLHGLQVLAFLALLLQRRRMPEEKAARILSAAALTCGSLFLITLIEALLKEPIINHDQVFVAVWTGWLMLSLVLFLHAIYPREEGGPLERRIQQRNI